MSEGVESALRNWESSGDLNVWAKISLDGDGKRCEHI
jgi:hypothetical protein